MLVHRLADDAFQLGGVRYSHTDGVHVDTVCSGLFCFRNGSAAVDVGHTASHHHGHIGSSGTVAIGCCVHAIPHGFESVGHVNPAGAVGHTVDGSEESPFILMFVEVELQVVLRAVADDTHTHVTVVNVGVGEEVFHKVLHDVEVGFRDTAGGVQHKHQVHRGVIPL